MNTNCIRCGKPLTDEESVKRGVGPECWKLIGAAVDACMDRDSTMYVPPLPNGDIVLQERCTNGGTMYVVGIGRRYAVKHSPTGLRWGYAGSGAADLALNVLIHATGDHAFAEKHYQDFKEAFIVRQQPEGGILKRSAIDEWIAERSRLNPSPPTAVQAEERTSVNIPQAADRPANSQTVSEATVERVTPPGWIGVKVVLSIEIDNGDQIELGSPLNLVYTASGLCVLNDEVLGPIPVDEYASKIATAPLSALSPKMRSIAAEVLLRLKHEL